MLGVATTPASDGWVTLMQRYEDVTPGGWEWGVALFFTTYAFLTRFLGMNLFMMTLLFKYKTHSDDKVGNTWRQGANLPRLMWVNVLVARSSCREDFIFNSGILLC